jgi:hypothetical protein
MFLEKSQESKSLRFVEAFIDNIFVLDHKHPDQPDLQQVKGVVDDDQRPGSVSASSETILADQAHPVAYKIGPILDEVEGEQDSKGYPAPTGKKHNTSGPDCAVNQAGKRLLFFIVRHPVCLKQIISDQVTEKCQG